MVVIEALVVIEDADGSKDGNGNKKDEEGVVSGVGRERGRGAVAAKPNSSPLSSIKFSEGIVMEGML